jgi:acyl-CoA dehydrogenase
MDFTLSPEAEALRRKVRDFVAAEILPLERQAGAYDAHENIALPVLEDIRAKVRAAGLWAPQMPVARGGLGLDTQVMAAFYEAANDSIFGPVCFNCAAPDDGNMFVLDKVASPEQKARWLAPIIDGAVRS